MSKNHGHRSNTKPGHGDVKDSIWKEKYYGINFYSQSFWDTLVHVETAKEVQVELLSEKRWTNWPNLKKLGKKYESKSADLKAKRMSRLNRRNSSSSQSRALQGQIPTFLHTCTARNYNNSKVSNFVLLFTSFLVVFRGALVASELHYPA